MRLISTAKGYLSNLGNTIAVSWRGGFFYKRALEVTWLVIVFLIPLFFNPAAHQAYYLQKALLLQFLVFIMLGLAAADWMLNRQERSSWWREFIKSPLIIAVLALGFFIILATIFSISPSVSFWGSWFRGEGLLTWLCWIVFAFILANYLRRRDQLMRLVYVLLASSAIVALLGILQHLFSEAMLQFFKSSTGDRVTSTTGNALSLSAFLAMVIPFNLAFIFHLWPLRLSSSHRRWLVSLSVLLALQIWCLILAQYSITILLFIVGAASFVAIVGVVSKNRPILISSVIGFITLGIIALNLVLPLFNNDISNKDTEIAPINITEPSRLETSIGYRVRLWETAVQIMLASPEIPFTEDKISGIRPLIGYGPETFIVTSQYMFPEELKSSHTYQALLYDRPHNHYLYIGTTTGLLGILAYATVLAIFLYLAFRKLLRSPPGLELFLLVGITASMLQYIIDSVFNPSTFSPEVIFWTLPAMLLYFNRPGTDKSEGNTSNIQYGVNHFRQYIAAGLASVLVISGFLLTAGPFQADMKLQMAFMQSTQLDPNAPFTYSEAIDANPREAAYWAARGEYILLVARLVESEDQKLQLLAYSAQAFEEALRLEPYIIFRYHALAEVYTYWAFHKAEDKWDKVSQFYQDILELSPYNAVMLDNWALSLIIEGDFDEANLKVEQAISADPGWPAHSYYSGVISTLKGEYDKAVSSMVLPLYDGIQNLRYFRDICFDIYEYQLIPQIIEALNSQPPSNWQVNVLLGVAGFFTVWEESIQSFDKAMSLIPDEESASLFRLTLDLANRVPEYGQQLAIVAAGWLDKLAQSPDYKAALVELDAFLAEFSNP